MSVVCCRVRDLQTRLRAEQKNLERLRKLPSPLDKKPQMQAELDEAAEKVSLRWMTRWFSPRAVAKMMHDGSWLGRALMAVLRSLPSLLCFWHF